MSDSRHASNDRGGLNQWPTRIETAKAGVAAPASRQHQNQAGSARNSFQYEIWLQAKSDSVHGIRWLLKSALRRFGLRCTHAQRIGSSP